MLMQTLARLRGDSPNYRVLRASLTFLLALILSCKIFHIYDSSCPVWFFHVILTVFLLFMIIFSTILARKRGIKLKCRQKSSFLLFWETFSKFISNFFELNKFLVPLPSTMSGLPWDDTARENLNMKNSNIATHWSWLVYW